MKIKRIYFTLLPYIIASILLLLNPKCDAFEMAANDVWYFESSVIGVQSLPDKADHFYRSYLMTQIIDIKKTVALDLMYEVYDGFRGVGFSKKDLLLDIIGAIAGTMHGEKYMTLLKWNRTEKNIILTLYMRF